MRRNPLTVQELSAIAARHAAATPGEWLVDVADYGMLAIYAHCPDDALATLVLVVPKERRADLAFCAAAHADVPRLLADLAEAQGQLGDLQEDHAHWVEYGRAMERAEIADALRARLPAAGQGPVWAQTYGLVIDYLERERGPAPEPTPADRARRECVRLASENERLRAALADALRVIEAYPGADPVTELSRVEAIAREALAAAGDEGR